MEASERKTGIRLFGVVIGGGVVREEKDGKEEECAGEEMIRKSQSMSNLAAAAADPAAESAAVERGYLSEGGLRKSGRRRRRIVQDRKKGVPWTEEEHRTFLEGLEKLGKGDWRGISRKFVRTRTPTQVASHAQKYFIRQMAATGRRRRRSSLFDTTFAAADNVSTSGVQKRSMEQLTEMVKEKGPMEMPTVIDEEDLLQMNLGVGGDGPIAPSCGLPGIDLQRRALARLIM